MTVSETATPAACSPATPRVRMDGAPRQTLPARRAAGVALSCLVAGCASTATQSSERSGHHPTTSTQIL
jgi:hypothetical protein